MNLYPFKELIRSYCGLTFENDKQVILETGIKARMGELGVGDSSAYYEAMLREPDERLRLIELLTINETYFYREPAYLKFLVNKFIPDSWRCFGARKRINILSAGCSTGEEVYTVAMALMDGFSADDYGLFSVFGVDIDARALAQARNGVYGGLSFRGMSQNLVIRHFDPMPDGKYRIKDKIRNMVVFKAGNLATDVFPDPNLQFDVILYRNVSIYFDKPTQMAMFRNLARRLNDGGVVIVSATETMGHNLGVLNLAEDQGFFYYTHPFPSTRAATPERLGSRRPAEISQRKSTNAKSIKPLAKPKPTGAPKIEAHPGPPSLGEAIALTAAGRFPEALGALEDFLGKSASAEGYALKAYLLLQNHRMDEAGAACRSALDLDRWNLEAHLLLGLVEKAQDRFDRAINSFREAIYIRSGCWPAHYLMAETYFLAGAPREARREYEITLRQLNGAEAREHGLTWLLPAFNQKQAALLSRHRLERQ